MAKIKWISFIKRLTGKIGDDVAQTWKGINYTRRRWKVDPKKRSIVQKANCTSFGNLSTLWKELSRESKDTWKHYARHAAMSGYNAFISENQKRRVAGLPLITEAPEGQLRKPKKY